MKRQLVEIIVFSGLLCLLSQPILVETLEEEVRTLPASTQFTQTVTQ